MAVLTRNLVTDHGAVSGTDCTAAFVSFKTWALANQGSDEILLTIPAGTYLTSFTNGPNQWVRGIKKLTVSGYGATLQRSSGAPFDFGSGGQYGDASHSARTVSVAAGASSVTLVNSGLTSLFTPGQYAFMAGFNIQDLWAVPYGQPSNHHFFEFLKINTSAGGVVTFTTPLTNSYLSTWPLVNSGSAGEPDAGGPATLYALPPEWDTELEFQGMTINQPGGQTYSRGRKVTWRDCTFSPSDVDGIIPTVNGFWQWINCTAVNQLMEVDKYNHSVIFNGGSVKKLTFQSSSTNIVSISNLTATTGIYGGGKQTTINNCTMGVFQPGPTAYGRADEVTITNSSMTSIGVGSFIHDGDVAGTGFNLTYTMSGGVISGPKTNGVGGSLRWAVPGTWCFWIGSSQVANGGMFQVLSVTDDATNWYVQTNLSGGYPAIPPGTGGKINIRPHPAPRFTMHGCTGCADAIAMSLAPAAMDRAPMYSYYRRSFTGDQSGQVTPGFPVWGNFVSHTATVSPLYSGVKATVGFWSFSGVGLKTDQTLAAYQPRVNTKFTGARVITPAGVTGTQSGDTGLALGVPSLWLSQSDQPGFNPVQITDETAATWPTIDTEIITDQGIPAAPSATIAGPLRLRLRG